MSWMFVSIVVWSSAFMVAAVRGVWGVRLFCGKNVGSDMDEVSAIHCSICLCIIFIMLI
jgi:hypothetical protein